MEHQLIRLGQHISMPIILRLWGVMCLVQVNSRKVDSSSNHPCSSFREDKLKILKFSKQQGAGSESVSRGATTITAVTRCPCYTGNSASYWTNPGIFSSVANLTSYSAGCAMAGPGEIQYLIPDASVGLENYSISTEDHQGC